MENIKIPFNDVFFYGVILRSRENADVRSDIFANILMRYLRTLKPVTNRLYRSTENARFEYNYSFIPSKPLSWRVIRNRRIIEEIEQLSDGKYCLNYYDDHGKDVKRVVFSNQHRWMKTNYYNSVYADNILCSLVPKEQNGETVILQYVTGATYSTTLHCCPKASCDEVLSSVLSRVPEPDIMALTNYGVLFFAVEETYNIFTQVLAEEEKKYAEAHKPEVFTSDSDVAGGFCFDIQSFDSSSEFAASFDLSEAQELTASEDIDDSLSGVVSAEVAEDSFDTDPVAEDAVDTDVTAAISGEIVLPASDTDEYSLDADISAAIKIITDTTDVSIDETVVFASDSETVVVSDDTADEVTDEDDFVIPAIAPSADNIVSVLDTEVTAEIFSDINGTETSDSAADSEDEASSSDTDETASVVAAPAGNTPTADLLTMADEEIDDYVSSLIDSILLDARESAGELLLDRDGSFTAGGDEASADNDSQNTSAVSTSYVDDNTPDITIESNGAEYFYYGEMSADGKREGRGKTLMSSGLTAYDGDYHSDMRHGVGSFYYKDGSLCYWGNWNSNLRTGFGLGISSETGVSHIGNWRENKPVGIGVRFDSDGKFMYIDSACERTNGGIRIVGFTDTSVIVEYWDENTLRTVKKEISIKDM